LFLEYVIGCIKITNGCRQVKFFLAGVQDFKAKIALLGSLAPKTALPATST